MIDFVNRDLFLQNSVPKKLFISCGDIVITNTELHSEKFSLKESLCSQSELAYGSCEASELEFTVSNVFTSLIGKTLTVEMAVNGDLKNRLKIGEYKVYSDVPTANRKDRTVKAYDKMYDILNADVTEWYNKILPTSNSKVTVAQFRASFMAHLGVTEKEIELINDNVYITRTIEPEVLSGKDVITKICEMNACFGHIGRSGSFEYIYLAPIVSGLYPREDLYPSETLYPRVPNYYIIGTKSYKSASSEDYISSNVTRIQIRTNDADIGVIHGTAGNDYIIQDNFLLYGKSSDELNLIAQRILDAIKEIYYRPFTAELVGNPCVEVGDIVGIGTKYLIIESYVLDRTLRGIQSLQDSIHAEGQPARKERVNGVQSSIKQLSGKTNELTRTIEETRLTMTDLAEGLSSEISATASGLQAEIADVQNGLSSEISATANQIRSAVENSDKELQTQITQNANSISAEVKRASDAEASLSIRADEITASVSTVSSNLKNNYYTITETESKISSSESGILLDVSKKYYTISEAGTAISNLQSQINVNAGNIALKTSAGDVQSMINVSIGNISLSASQINLEGYFTANRGFSIDEYGNAILSSGDATCFMSGGYLVIGRNNAPGIFIGDGEVSCSKINGSTPVNANNFGNYFTTAFNDTGTDSNLNNLNQWCLQLDNKFSNYSPTTHTHSNYLTSSDLYGYATSSELSSLNTDLNNKMNGLDSGLTYVRTRITELSDTVSVHSGYISSFTSSIGSLGARVAALEAAIQ